MYAKCYFSVVALSSPLRHRPDTQNELKTGPDIFSLYPGGCALLGLRTVRDGVGTAPFLSGVHREGLATMW